MDYPSVFERSYVNGDIVIIRCNDVNDFDKILNSYYTERSTLKERLKEKHETREINLLYGIIFDSLLGQKKSLYKFIAGKVFLYITIGYVPQKKSLTEIFS